MVKRMLSVVNLVRMMMSNNVGGMSDLDAELSDCSDELQDYVVAQEKIIQRVQVLVDEISDVLDGNFEDE